MEKTETIYTPEELQERFGGLQSITGSDTEIREEMRGKWEGGFYKTGKSPYELMLKGWWGKNFKGKEIEALIYNFLGVKFNIPFFGSATLQRLPYQDESTAAIVYNNLPVIDYLRKEDDGTIMGIFVMNNKTEVYFWLKRTKES